MILKNRSLCIGCCLTLFFLSGLPAFPFESYQEKSKQWLAERWDGRNLSMGSPKAGRKKRKNSGYLTNTKACYIHVAKYQKLVSLWSQPQNTFRYQATFMQIPDELSLGYRFHNFLKDLLIFSHLYLLGHRYADS